MKCPSLSLVILCILRSSLSDVNIVTSDYPCLVLNGFYFFIPLLSKFYVKGMFLVNDIYWVGQKVCSGFSLNVLWKNLNEPFGQPE